MPPNDGQAADQSTNNSAQNSEQSQADRLYNNQSAENKDSQNADQNKDDQNKNDDQNLNKDQQNQDDKKADDQKADDQKKNDDQKKADDLKDGDKKDDVKIELKVPEKSDLSKEQVDSVVALAKENKLNQDQAQKVLESVSQAVADFKKSQADSLEAKKVEWASLSKNDKEIGGEAFENNLVMARKGYALMPESWRNFLEVTGLGSHPDSIKFCLKIAKSGAPDKLVPAGNESHKQDDSYEKRLYPNMN